MKKFLLGTLLLSGVVATALPAMAQENPPPPVGDRGGDRPGPPRGPQGDRQGRPMREGRGEMRDGEGPMRPPGPPVDGMPPEVRRMMGYISLVDQFSKIARDENTAGVAAVITAADILRPRGADAAIKYFEELLPQTESPAVRNAIRMQLADFYRNSGQQEKALAQLSDIIKGSHGGSAPPAEGAKR